MIYARKSKIKKTNADSDEDYSTLAALKALEGAGSSFDRAAFAYATA